MDAVERVLADWHQERPDLDPSPIGIFGRIRRISGMARRELERYLAPFGLTPSSFDVLANLRRSGHPYRKTPSQLAESSLLTTGAMTGRLDGLVALGLIVRVPSPSDRRIMYAELTDEGLKLINDVLGVHLDNEDALLAELSHIEREQVSSALATLERAMQTALERRQSSATTDLIRRARPLNGHREKGLASTC